ncbi:39S ribosomal protein L52, mitochondrial [Chionoecetes opilio]|uniref:Large ribosomal subunit protein mL52 n=1 Tax=Chionoecetes opilio TaxID=41210 RepID=A0A8J4XVH2_CHIOP|nr:39S ribosomal protein L52, mitochondrial [Chionoecetes opilio]
MRWHVRWQGLLAASVTKNFSSRSASQVKGGLTLQPKTDKERAKKIRSVGSFKTSMGACGPLIDGADYTFLDGRPTPLRINQMRRAKEQREAAAKVVQLMKETQFAIQREKQTQQEKEAVKQQYLQTKLKAKGHKLLEKQEK